MILLLPGWGCLFFDITCKCYYSFRNIRNGTLDMEQISLLNSTGAKRSLPPVFAPLSLEEKVARVKAVFRDLILEGNRCLLAYSSGKDSSVMASIVLCALDEMKQAGELSQGDDQPSLVIVHSNTRLENPVVSAFAYAELTKIRAFIKERDLPARVDVVQPNLSNNYLVALIGGRMVATMPGMPSNCSIMMKLAPIESHKKRIFKAFGKKNVFTAVGTRRDESDVRSNAMEQRGDSEWAPVENEKGDRVWSPIADFDLGDVFQYIGEVRRGMYPSYSDFDDLGEHYRDLNGGECMVTVYATGRASKSGCGARSGCHLCLKSREDHSLINMLKESRFTWMKALNDFRNFIGYHHWDPSRRRWLARRINDDGTINLNPTAYSASHTEDMLRYALTIQRREWIAADAGGFDPRFTLIRPADVVAIQLLWARYGFHKPAAALQIWDEVMNQGVEYNVPELDMAKAPHDRSSLKYTGQKSVFLFDDEHACLFNGFRDIDAATAGAERLVIKANGGVYAEANTGFEFDIDEEAAELFLGIELPRILRDQANITSVSIYHKLIRMGIVTLKRGDESQQERMLILANQIERLGLAGLDSSIDALIETAEILAA